MAESLEADPLIGRLVSQKFKVERLLGAGAMGRVYLAEQTNLGKQVALKVLHNAMSGDAALAKRFYREAKSASMLAHPNILQIIDFGDDGGLLFIAMELLTGRDLYRVIKTEWPFALERIGHIGGQILGALDEAHAKGVVHRDLKPENVMLLDVRGESDFVKVCDFGIAKVASERDGEGSAITMAGMVCGTPEYMSPEQARGDALDGRSDLYAAAVILYQMVVGDVPFRAESALGVITKHLTETPTPPTQRRQNANIPPALEAVILRGLEKKKDDRFASASEMKAALLESCGLKRSSSTSNERVRASGIVDIGTAATGVATPASVPQQPAAGPRGRTGVVVGALAALLIVGGGAYVVVKRQGPTPTPTPTKMPTTEQKQTEQAPTPEKVVQPIPPAPEPPTPTIVAAAAPPAAHVAHHHEKAHAAAAPKPAMAIAAAPKATAAAATAPVAAPPAAPKSAFAEGEMLFKSGDVEGALAKYQEAARANPSDAKTQRQIGKCYNRLGQRDRAQPYLKKYLELAPDAGDAEFIRAMLDGK